MRAGLKLAASRGVTAVHDKDGWLGALRLWQRLERGGVADAARLAVGSRRPGRSAADARHRARASASPMLRLGYLKAFMDGTLGSQTALMLDGSGVRITSGEELDRDRPRRRRGGLPGGSARDRRRREPRGARRVRADARRSGRRSGSATGSSTRSCSRPRTSRASPSSASRARCSSRTRLPTATSPTASGRARPTAPTPTARSSTRAPSSPTAPTRRSRSSTRSPASAPASGGRSTSGRPWHPEQALTVAAGVRGDDVAPGLARGRRAPPRQAAPGLRGRPRRARPRPVGRPRRAGRRDDGRRPLGAQPAALGIAPH